MAHKVYSFLGLMMKAGKLILGEEKCYKTIKNKSRCLLIIANDISDNTRKKILNICKYKNIEYRIYGEKKLLGECVGKNICVVIVILDKMIKEHILKLIDTSFESGSEVIGKNKDI